LLLAGVLAAGCSWAPVLPEEPVAETTWRRWGTFDSHEARGGFPGTPPAGQLSRLPADEMVERPAVLAVGLAHELIGTPYRWGGASPAGFDCSGLVYYTFREAGIDVPRTSQQQYRVARPVPLEAVEPGDLLFFAQRGRIFHVGIYAGDGHFIHAPVAGRPVSVARLDDQYYRRHFAGAGRVD
jgi:cell wall-associated NlpC family hydrolase